MLAALTPPVFAVLDGAFWPDVTAELPAANLFGRSLFLGAGQEVERAGPWLVPLPDLAARDAVLALVADRPAAVFWSWPGEEAELWHHLRTLNQVRIPNEADPPKTEVVTFRHWDPRALAAVLPVLDEEQFARVLGAAEAVVFADPLSGCRKALADPAVPAPTGRLQLRPDQMAGLQERLVARSHRRIGAYLRDVAPDHTGALTDAELRRVVAHSDATGREFGLRSEQAHGRWAYLMVVSDGRIATVPEVRSFMAEPGANPDIQARRLMQAAMAAAVARPQ